MIHCLAGHGRTGTMAAAALIAAGYTPRKAIAAVRGSRKGTLQVPQQVQWLMTTFHDEIDRYFSYLTRCRSCSSSPRILSLHPPNLNPWHEVCAVTFRFSASSSLQMLCLCL